MLDNIKSIMKFSGKKVEWSVIETSDFRRLHDYKAGSVKVLKVEFPDDQFAFAVKINEREDWVPWLGPGMFLTESLELRISEEQVGKCFYIRPRITSMVASEVTELEVERIIQWVFSAKFRFIESLYYNCKKVLPG